MINIIEIKRLAKLMNKEKLTKEELEDYKVLILKYIDSRKEIKCIEIEKELFDVKLPSKSNSLNRTPKCRVLSIDWR